MYQMCEKYHYNFRALQDEVLYGIESVLKH
jgi:hypothetical protein